MLIFLLGEQHKRVRTAIARTPALEAAGATAASHGDAGAYLQPRLSPEFCVPPEFGSLSPSSPSAFMGLRPGMSGEGAFSEQIQK